MSVQSGGADVTPAIGRALEKIRKEADATASAKVAERKLTKVSQHDAAEEEV